MVYNITMRYCGFPPLFDSSSRILILGSFPSVKSREQNFYYGNKQNRFWQTLNKAFQANAQTVDEKKQLCLSCGIALWDIVTSCEIHGSMDTDIKNYRLADLSQILSRAPISKILCNGAKAYQLTKSSYFGDVPVVKMPSTSPANARFDEQAWLAELQLH